MHRPRARSDPAQRGPGGGLATILDGAVGKTLLPGVQPSSQVPVYPPAPHCNTRGLTPLGVYLLDQMVKRHLVVQLDHMDAKTADRRSRC